MTSPDSKTVALPADLAAAEQSMFTALSSALKSGDGTRWSAALRFENLRILPVALRLSRALIALDPTLCVLWPDAGAAALARRDASDLSDCILDFRQWMQRVADQPTDGLLLVVLPQPADYEDFEQVCAKHAGAIVMLNGRLEDAAVGIGSVARERRRGFVASWRQAFWVEPIDGGALMRCYPDGWRLYRSDPDGYRQIAVFEQRPGAEEIAETLSGDGPDSLKQQLSSVDRFLDGLRN